jgi:stringent starvation protein B
MLQKIQIQISEQGIDTITLSYAPDRREWLDILSRATWALDLLNGTIRYHSRNIIENNEPARHER